MDRWGLALDEPIPERRGAEGHAFDGAFEEELSAVLEYVVVI
jgi:hypothetical protein